MIIKHIYKREPRVIMDRLYSNTYTYKGIFYSYFLYQFYYIMIKYIKGKNAEGK